MRKTFVVVAGALLGIAAASWCGVGWAQQGTAGKAGEALDGAGKAIKRGLQSAGQSVREGFAKTRTAVHNMGVESRVYGRLHWDVALYTSPLEVEVQAGGVTTLRGTVPDAAAKAKAVTLTKDTVGVVSVVDQLAVVPPPRTVPVTPPATAPPPAP